ncbi:MAG: hypothetical protein K6T61_14655 [Bryobacteraceae bacterium]|nr:hypothetical protein [Bryobacteraceae bacterium]
MDRAKFDLYPQRIRRNYCGLAIDRWSITPGTYSAAFWWLLGGNRLGARHRLPGVGLAQLAGALGAKSGGTDARSAVKETTGQAAQAEAAGSLKKVCEVGAERVVADKGYLCKSVFQELAVVGVRILIAEPECKRQRWERQRAAQATVYANRRLQSRTARALMRRHGKRIERSFAHLDDTGGTRRVHLRGKSNIAKRLLIHVAAFNLSLILRQLLRVGTAPQAAELIAALWLCLLPLVHTVNCGLLVVGPRWPTTQKVNPHCHHPSPPRRDVSLSTGCWSPQDHFVSGRAQSANNHLRRARRSDGSCRAKCSPVQPENRK